jgi:thiol-disulfide isomerase/thioredoxin
MNDDSSGGVNESSEADPPAEAPQEKTEMDATTEEKSSEHQEGMAEVEKAVATAVEQQAAEAPMSGEASPAEDMSDRPLWQQLPLTNARTGETFTLADFAGKTVFVEPMATWCGNCRRQLTNVGEAKQQLASDDVVFIALSVETNIDDATLAQYADGAGFDWTFAVLSAELLGELANEFGRVITNPPSTPHFIIRSDGASTDLVTGIEPAGDILAQIAAAQG